MHVLSYLYILSYPYNNHRASVYLPLWYRHSSACLSVLRREHRRDPPHGRHYMEGPAGLRLFEEQAHSLLHPGRG